MKQTGMFFVSLRDVNFWFLVLLRVFRAKHKYLGSAKKHRITRGWFFSMIIYVFTSLKLIACRICVFLSGLF